MGDPLVSIGLPFYNCEDYLLDSIRSIFAQTYTNWELILVDDGSTDNGMDIALSIDDPRVKVLPKDGKNLWLAARLNQITQAAKGKYIARMDADDMSMPTRIEKQIVALGENSKIDVLGCGTVTINNDFTPVLTCQPVKSHEEITRWASLNFPLMHPSIIAKAEWFKRWPYNPKIRYAQDFELFFRAHTKSVFANIPDILYVYRYVGVTSPLKAKIESVYYKSIALLQNGFRMGLPGKTLLGLASMAPRPFLYVLKAALGKHKKGLVKSQGIDSTDADNCILKAGLAEIAKAEVPLKHG
jgi:glycosyltransferase involved in cell wall biosynthesis